MVASLSVTLIVEVAAGHFYGTQAEAGVFLGSMIIVLGWALERR
jgi:hypothetical protein